MLIRVRAHRQDFAKCRRVAQIRARLLACAAVLSVLGLVSCSSSGGDTVGIQSCSSAGGSACGAVAQSGAGGSSLGTTVAGRGSGTAGATLPVAGVLGVSGASGVSAGSGAGRGGAPSSVPAAGAGAGGTTSVMDEDAGIVDAGAEPPVSCPAMAGLRPGETNRMIEVGGVMRSYLLHVPPKYTGDAPVPLVLDWHGLLLDGATERQLSGYAELADQEGFIVAFPNGIDAAWNIGPCCTTSRTVDDVGFAKALVAELERLACIDPKRVYSVGFSMGGGMSHYLACNAADVFAAVAPSAFDLLAEDEEPCHPARPITVIFFRGTADFIVPYEGGASNPPNGLPVTIHFRGAQGTFERWKMLNGCTGTSTKMGECETYANCADGVETTLCSAQGGSHAPGDAKVGWATVKRYTLP